MIRRILTCAALVAATAPAVAQNGAMWVDDHGRMMTMQFAGGSGEPPVSADRSAAEMAALFKTLCLESGGDPKAIGAIAHLGDLALEPQPFTIAGTKKAEPLTLNIWRGKGVVLSQTDGFFAAPVEQCSAAFYVNSLPEQQALAEALTTAIGAGPSNPEDAVKKNGKPNKWYTPEWSWTGLAGSPHIITAHVAQANNYMPGNRVQITVRARKEKDS